MQPAVVVPVDPLQGGDLDLVDGRATDRGGLISSVLNSPIVVSARALS